MTGVAGGRRAVFVVGCPRSGTTLLQQLLNAHPDVSIGPETHFVHRFWVERARYGDLAWGDGWARLVRDVASMPELGDIGIDPENVVRAAAGVERHPGRLLGVLLDLFGRGAAVTGEKTPNHVLHMRLLESWIPGARFLHVVRDPRAVVSSWRSVPWSSGAIGGDADIWRRHVRAAERLPPSDGRLLTVPYERLVEDPGPELRTICGFLGVDFDPAMLEHHRSGPVGLDPGREPWKRRAAEPVSRARAERWRDELTPFQVFRVEATVGGLLERAGYAARFRRPLRLSAGPFLRLAARGRRFLKRRAGPA